MFYLEKFSTVDLPLLEARQTISSGESLSAFRQMQDGGAYRVRGTQRSPRQITRITTSGEFVTDTPVDIDALGHALYGERGKLAKLYRRTHGSQERHWCWAELMRVGADNTPDTFLVQPVAPEFTMISPCWYGVKHGPAWLWGSGEAWGSGVAWDQGAGDSFELPSSETSVEAEVENGGNYPIDNAILRVTAGPAEPLSGLEIIVDGEVHLIYNGTIPADGSLVIDCGARSVQLVVDATPTADVYDDFEIGPTHALAGWLRLHPGTTSITVDYATDDNATFLVTFSEGQE